MALGDVLGLDPHQDIDVAGHCRMAIEIDLDDGAVLAQVAGEFVETGRRGEREGGLLRALEMGEARAYPAFETGQIPCLNILQVDVGMAFVADGQRRPDRGLAVLVPGHSPDADGGDLLARRVADAGRTAE